MTRFALCMPPAITVPYIQMRLPIPHVVEHARVNRTVKSTEYVV